MTRKKKSRSLKRIHSVKTGNISKLKRAGTTDRQNSNLKDKNKPKSVYQKFLEENPDAIEKQPISTAKKKAEAATITANIDAQKAGKKDDQLSDRKAKTNASKEERIKDSRESKPEKEPDLLSQLENKNFNDFY